MTRAEDIEKALNDTDTAIAETSTRVADTEKALKDTIDQLNKTAGEGLDKANTDALEIRLQAALANVRQIGKPAPQPIVVPPALPGPFGPMQGPPA